MPDNISENDQLLIQKIKEGNRRAFKKLFDRYWHKLFAVAVNRLQSKARAEDVIQELFTDLWARRQTLEIEHKVSSYLYGALRFLIIDQMRKKSTYRKYADAITRQYDTNDLSTENQVSYNQLNDELDKQMAQLPDRCRQVFILSRYEQYSHKEIAEKLDISYKTVENHIGRALRTLRPSLNEIVSLMLLLLTV